MLARRRRQASPAAWMGTARSSWKSGDPLQEAEKTSLAGEGRGRGLKKRCSVFRLDTQLSQLGRQAFGALAFPFRPLAFLRRPSPFPFDLPLFPLDGRGYPNLFGVVPAQPLAF